MTCRTLATAFLAIGLTGCAYLTPPFEQPIIEQHAQNHINTFAVVPSRRMMIVKKVDITDGKPAEHLVCAEAPADVTDNLASTLAASLAVSGPGKGDKTAEASAAVNSTLNTYAQFLFKRTQGIQLYRDRAYHLCQARMNDFISKEQYYSSMESLLTQVIPLITAELQYLDKSFPASQPNAQATASAPAASASSPKTSAKVGP